MTLFGFIHSLERDLTIIFKSLRSKVIKINNVRIGDYLLQVKVKIMLTK